MTLIESRKAIAQAKDKVLTILGADEVDTSLKEMLPTIIVRYALYLAILQYGFVRGVTIPALIEAGWSLFGEKSFKKSDIYNYANRRLWDRNLTERDAVIFCCDGRRVRVPKELKEGDKVLIAAALLFVEMLSDGKSPSDMRQVRSVLIAFRKSSRVRKVLNLHQKTKGKAPTFLDIDTFKKTDLGTCLEQNKLLILQVIESVTHGTKAFGDRWATDCFVVSPDQGDGVCGWGVLFTDIFTRLIVGYQTFDHKPTCAEIAKVLVEAIDCFEAPRRIMHDHGGEFTGSEFQEVLQFNRIHDDPTEVARPWMNCVAERLNGTIKRWAIQILTNKDGSVAGIDSVDIKEINRAISQAVESYNTAFHSTIGTTPRQAYEAQIAKRPATTKTTAIQPFTQGMVRKGFLNSEYGTFACKEFRRLEKQRVVIGRSYNILTRTNRYYLLSSLTRPYPSVQKLGEGGAT